MTEAAVTSKERCVEVLDDNGWELTFCERGGVYTLVFPLLVYFARGVDSCQLSTEHFTQLCEVVATRGGGTATRWPLYWPDDANTVRLFCSKVSEGLKFNFSWRKKKDTEIEVFTMRLSWQQLSKLPKLMPRVLLIQDDGEKPKFGLGGVC